MSATTHAVADLTPNFGLDGASGSVILTSFESTISNQIAEALDEDGDVVAIAIYGGERAAISGEFLWEGAAIGALGSALTLTITGFTPPAGSSIFVTENGIKYTNTAFATGSFKAIAISGIAVA